MPLEKNHMHFICAITWNMWKHIWNKHETCGFGSFSWCETNVITCDHMWTNVDSDNMWQHGNMITDVSRIYHENVPKPHFMCVSYVFHKSFHMCFTYFTCDCTCEVHGFSLSKKSLWSQKCISFFVFVFKNHNFMNSFEFQFYLIKIQFKLRNSILNAAQTWSQCFWFSNHGDFTTSEKRSIL